MADDRQGTHFGLIVLYDFDDRARPPSRLLIAEGRAARNVCVQTAALAGCRTGLNSGISHD